MTLGKRGVLALVDDEPLIIPGHAVNAIDTTGAGDCFVGAVAAQLAGGKSIRDALDYANAAASICVQRMGAAPSMPTAAEVSFLVPPANAGTHNPHRLYGRKFSLSLSLSVSLSYPDDRPRLSAPACTLGPNDGLPE